MNKNTSDQRRHPRHKIFLHASLLAVGVVVPCRVRNISAGGVLIEANVQLRIGDRATVKIPDFGTIAGSVARVSSTTVGIAFDEGEEAMDSFIDAWLALESPNTALPERSSVEANDRQAV